MKVTVILAIVVSFCHVYGAEVKEDASNKDLFYVFGERKCVPSGKDNVCSVDYKIPAYYNAFASMLTNINSTISNLDSVPKNCSDLIMSLMCSAVTPRCSDAEKTLDFGNINATCQKIFDVCPKFLVDAYKKINLCGNYISGKFDEKQCVAPSGKIEGSCPQPDYKMPPNLLAQYTITSKSVVGNLNTLKNAATTNGTTMFSPSCIADYTKMACTSMYCSHDGQRVLVKNSKQDCLELLNKCFLNLLDNDALKPLRKIIIDACDQYPDKSHERESITGNNKEIHYVSKSLFASILVFFFMKNVA